MNRVKDKPWQHFGNDLNAIWARINFKCTRQDMKLEIRKDRPFKFERFVHDVPKTKGKLYTNKQLISTRACMYLAYHAMIIRLSRSSACM